MKIIKNTHKLEHFSSKIINQYFEDMRMGVFDIETMGLNPSRCPIILTGFMVISPNGDCTVTQYFADTPEDERLILEYLKKDFEAVDYVLTYNGKHFDLPFVEKRAAILGMDGFDFNFYNMDLYLILNGHSQLKYLIKNLRQKTVEEYMGLQAAREDEISGAESVSLYEAFLMCQNDDEKKALREKILLHNHDDLIQLYKLMPILRSTDIHKAFNSLGFPVKGHSGWPYMNLTSVKVSYTGLTLLGRYYGEPFSYMSYDTFTDNFSCEFNTENRFSFKIRTERHKGNTFINLKLYFDDYEDFKIYPNYVNDFLFISGGSNINALEINMFAKKFLQRFMDENICPLMVL